MNKQLAELKDKLIDKLFIVLNGKVSHGVINNL